MNKSNDGYFGKRFVKVCFNVLHQFLALELPPAEVTTTFSVKKNNIKKKKGKGKKQPPLVWRTRVFVW